MNLIGLEWSFGDLLSKCVIQSCPQLNRQLHDSEQCNISSLYFRGANYLFSDLF
jgi:hypothetical protein